MSDNLSGLLTIGLLVVLLAVCYHPLGAWMAKVFTDTRHWRVERRRLPAGPRRPRLRAGLARLCRQRRRVLRRRASSRSSH